eukprot:6482238-Prymnesium_polylepis.1
MPTSCGGGRPPSPNPPTRTRISGASNPLKPGITPACWPHSARCTRSVRHTPCVGCTQCPSA